MARWPDSIPKVEQNIFLFSKPVRIQWENWLFLGVKRLEREAEHSSSSDGGV
jgi:hypothetical protein